MPVGEHAAKIRGRCMHAFECAGPGQPRPTSSEPELQRFGHMVDADVFVAGKVGNRAGHPVDSIEATRGQPESFRSRAEQVQARRIQGAVAAQV